MYISIYINLTYVLQNQPQDKIKAETDDKSIMLVSLCVYILYIYSSTWLKIYRLQTIPKIFVSILRSWWPGSCVSSTEAKQRHVERLVMKGRSIRSTFLSSRRKMEDTQRTLFIPGWSAYPRVRPAHQFQAVQGPEANLIDAQQKALTGRGKVCVCSCVRAGKVLAI